MKREILVLCAVLLAVSLCAAEKDEHALKNLVPVSSRIRSIGLFKNGMAYVKCDVTINKPGRYIVSDVPEPVYGTFSVECGTAEVTAKVAEIETEEEIEEYGVSLGNDFAGKEVTVYLKGDKQNSPLRGKVVPEKLKKKRAWKDKDDGGYRGYSYRMRPPASTPTYLSLETEEGITVLDTSMISHIKGAKRNNKKRVLSPRLILEAEALPAGRDHRIEVQYMTKGIAWAASYQFDISDGKELSILQKAVIKNEFASFTDAEVKLISGYPNIRFSHVVSPLSLLTTWDTFFRQLKKEVQSPDDSRGAPPFRQAVSPEFMPAAPPPRLPGSRGESIDIYYHSIGKRSLAEGEAIALPITRKKTTYEKIVLWDIPDILADDGTYVSQYDRHDNPEKYQESVWDSLRFKNPFPFPMTTAAAIFIKNGEFLGESISYWVNSGEETLVRTNRALSISTRKTEKVNAEKSSVFEISGDKYQKAQIDGTLAISNSRQAAVKVVIKRRISGELLEAQGKPKCFLQKSGTYSINKRNELIWEFTLKPGEEKTLTYKYEVLVDIE